ncbi:hypothetical protein [Georgenia alba]|uniref:WXG100 family type VII secretion target n=1 Tax=Georgenia alba TaxID=2233858 RepID=A0ABW2Q6I9_9MICO
MSGGHGIFTVDAGVGSALDALEQVRRVTVQAYPQRWHGVAADRYSSAITGLLQQIQVINASLHGVLPAARTAEDAARADIASGRSV